jgi:hypothetical protein
MMRPGAACGRFFAVFPGYKFEVAASEDIVTMKTTLAILFLASLALMTSGTNA